MKRYSIPLALLVSVIMMAAPTWAQLSGAKTINPAGTGSNNFTSFKQALDTLNTYGVGASGVTFTIASGTYNETAALAINPLAHKPAAANPVTFAPANGATVVLNVPTANNRYAFTIGSDTNFVDYVTLNGSNGSGSTRNWTINASASDSSQGVLVYGDHVQIKNIVVTVSTPWSNAPSNGIVLHQTGSSDYCLVDNCDVTANYGIIVGAGTGSTQVGNVINGNTVHCLTRGIAANQSSDITVTNNEVIGNTTLYPASAANGILITNATTTSGSVVIDGNKVHDFGTNTGAGQVIITGINAGSKGGTYSITRNKVYNFFNATSVTATTLEVQGINLTNGDGTSTFDVSNNFVYGFEDNETDAMTNKFTAGIRSQTGGKVYIYSNTVFIKNTTRNHSTMAFACGAGLSTDTVYVYNNIFHVDQTGLSTTSRSYCIYKGGSHPGGLVSDYNVLVNNGTGTNSYIGNPSGATFTAWKATGRDLHSSTKPAVFADSVSDLHLAGTSVGDVALTGIPALWITTDIDGDARNAKYPYMGADEASAPLAGVRVSSNAVGFGTVALGDSVVKSVMLKPLTTNAVIVTSVSASVADFTCSLATPRALTDSAELKITFKPHAGGVYAASVSVVSDCGTASIAVSGDSPQTGPSTMSGAYTIDLTKSTSGTNFKTFTDACAALTANGVSGAVTMTVASGTYNEAGILSVNPRTNKPAEGKGITFVPAAGATVVLNIPTGAGQYAFTIGSGDTNSVDYVTLNGSNGSGNTRNWTINAVGPDSSHGMVVYGDHVQIKNIILALSSPWSNAPSNGIVLHQTGSSDNCLVDNCDVTANYGIVVGTGGGATQTGNAITRNTIHCLTRGISANQSSDIIISNNEVIGNSTLYPLGTMTGILATNAVTTSGTVVIDGNKVHDLGTNTGTTAAVTITGITAGGKGANYSITKNRVYNLFNATSHATTNVQAQGITLSNGDPTSRFDVSNNFVYGFEDNDADASGNWTAGIRPITAGKVYVYFNTVFIKHTARNHYAAAYICGGGVDAKDTNYVYNNIFYVDQTGISSSYKSYCIYKGASFLGTLVTDYNELTNYGGGANSAIGSPSGATFAAWQASGRDLHSVSKSVAFVDSVTDLHLAGASLGDAALTGIPASWVPQDIDGNARSVKYPYMGADEATVPLAAIGVSKSALNFGTATVGDSVVGTVYIKSMTKNNITVTSVTSSLPDYKWIYTVPATVADSSALVITFKPHAAGMFADTLTIKSDIGTAIVVMSGVGQKTASNFLAEDFTSPVGTVLTAAGWLQSGTSATNPLTVTGNGLSFGKYAGSGVGNALTLASTGQDVYTTFGPMNSGSVYLTFMANVSSAGTGDYFIALSPSTAQTNYYARLHLKAVTGGYVVGISKSNEVSGGAQYGTTVLPLNTTNLIVVKYTFTAPPTPADTANDPISVYVFSSAVPASEPATAEISGYMAPNKVDAADLGIVTLRQGSTGAAPALVLDGIRIGTTWAISVPTGVNAATADVPRVFTLGQNYPNPFNPSTMIDFTVPNDAYTTLRVYNILGQPVADLYSGIAQAGRVYKSSFDAAHLPSGIYFARLESGEKISIKKMMLMK